MMLISPNIPLMKNSCFIVLYFSTNFSIKLHLVNLFRLMTLDKLPPSLVEFLVPKKAWPPAEVSSAYVTGIRLLTCVGSPVFNKMGVLTKFFSTFMTCKGLLSSVSSLVCMEICILTEAFPAFLTFKRLLCCTFFLVTIHKFQQLLFPSWKLLSFLYC